MNCLIVTHPLKIVVKMKLSEVKNHLKTVENIQFILPNGSFIPSHFHVTEVGGVTRNFIDCGGTVRITNVINFQLWEDGDLDHKLVPEKLLNIIALSEEKLSLGDFEIEVEYQAETIGKYHLDFDGTNFLLVATKTDCLAPSLCGTPEEKTAVSITSLGSEESNACTPGGGCC